MEEERNVGEDANNPASTDDTFNPIVHGVSCCSSSSNSTKGQEHQESVGGGEDEAELKTLLTPDLRDLPLTPPSAVESNFVPYFAPGGVTAIDFNVGKSDRSGIKVTGKRKKVCSLYPEFSFHEMD
ncbi:hypothetical protein U1Q18_043581 [Sarracenia purpurea var. burkii]